MSTELANVAATEFAVSDDITLEDCLEIIDDYVRKKYLTRLSGMEIVESDAYFGDIESDLIDNIRLYRIDEMVYLKGEPVTDKFTTVFNTLSTYNASVFVVIDSDGQTSKLYLGVRNNDPNEFALKRSTVTLGDTLKRTLVGHFPGAKVVSEDRKTIADLCKKIEGQNNVASVSVVGNSKFEKDVSNEEFVQGLEKLILAMDGRPFTGLVIATNQPSDCVQKLRHDLQDAYTKISPLQKVQLSESNTKGTSRSKSFFEMDEKQKVAAVASAVAAVGGAVIGTVVGDGAGTIVGGQIGGQLGGLIGSLAPVEQIQESRAMTMSTTTENREVTDMMKVLDELIEKTDEYDSYGMWNVAGYFVSDDMSTAEIAASNYRSLMNGENTGREISAINSWRRLGAGSNDGFSNLVSYLARFRHPLFMYGGGIFTDATTSVTGKELGLHLGLPRATVPGLPVIEHAEFGKEVTEFVLGRGNKNRRPEDRITLGNVFDLGKITGRVVELDNKSLNMHTFITGSTGSGKSSAVYQLLTELKQDNIPFLVIEPAKGEYKDVFGHMPDVRVFSTNPNIAPLVNLNPFRSPESIHVLEHVDGLVEIFSVCWPMYDAMPAFFKDAILKSYEYVGWDLGSSTFEGEKVAYPDFEILADQLDELIGNSDYASDIKSNYRGALLTRVKSLTVGLNKYIFTTEQTPYQQLFDENCILDISRVKSNESKALIMGLMVYILNEYRVDGKNGSNKGLKHITVLEEAHNLLKNTKDGSSELVGKSVEMLTNTIAEIRTYGEGFIIVDQSPSSVDIAAIKNTNTKIVLRTPEANDREAVGKSMGLNDDQINEVAKLPTGVAVVYQNNWINPVLVKVERPDLEEIPFVNEHPVSIKPIKKARTELLHMLMQPWLKGAPVGGKTLLEDLRAVGLNRKCKERMERLIAQYLVLGGKQVWRVSDIGLLQGLVKATLGVTNAQFDNAITTGDPNEIRRLVRQKTCGLNAAQIDEVCNVLTKVGEND